jgi:hypothetical protein
MMKPHKWAKEIIHWANGGEIEFYNHLKSRWEVATDVSILWIEEFEYRIKLQTKCIVKDCMNHTNEGRFVGELCAPCWDYITNGKGVHSQAYRNAQPKKPQYLYVYRDCPMLLSLDFNESYKDNYIGKIKLEVDDD